MALRYISLLPIYIDIGYFSPLNLKIGDQCRDIKPSPNINTFSIHLWTLLNLIEQHKLANDMTIISAIYENTRPVIRYFNDFQTLLFWYHIL